MPGAVEGFGAGGEVGCGELASDVVEEAVFAEEDSFGEAAGLLPKGLLEGHGAGGAGFGGLIQAELNAQEGGGGEVPEGGVMGIEEGAAEDVDGGP